MAEYRGSDVTLFFGAEVGVVVVEASTDLQAQVGIQVSKPPPTSHCSSVCSRAWKMADQQSIFWPTAAWDPARRRPLPALDNSKTTDHDVSYTTFELILAIVPITYEWISLTLSLKFVALQPDKSASLPAILAALVPSLISAVILLAVFLVVKKPFRRIYSPRTYMDVIPEK